VPQGGVLLALPALLATGLLRFTGQMYTLPQGYYGIDSIFLLLALMALARIPSMEQLRYVAPGEWGNLLGLDPIPEVRTLRATFGAQSLAAELSDVEVVRTTCASEGNSSQSAQPSFQLA